MKMGDAYLVAKNYDGRLDGFVHARIEAVGFLLIDDKPTLCYKIHNGDHWQSVLEWLPMDEAKYDLVNFGEQWFRIKTLYDKHHKTDEGYTPSEFWDGMQNMV